MGEALWCGTPRSRSPTDGRRPADQGRRERRALRRRARACGGDGSRPRVRPGVVDLLSDPSGARAPRPGRREDRRERSAPRPSISGSRTPSIRAQDHAAAWLIGAADRPRVLQWMTTFQHFRPWTTFNGASTSSVTSAPRRTTRRRRPSCTLRSRPDPPPRSRPRARAYESGRRRTHLAVVDTREVRAWASPRSRLAECKEQHAAHGAPSITPLL